MIGTEQNYLILKRIKAKVYVCKTFLLRGLIMELYCLPAPNRRERAHSLIFFSDSMTAWYDSQKYKSEKIQIISGLWV